jgi:hypothetical protein
VRPRLTGWLVAMAVLLGAAGPASAARVVDDDAATLDIGGDIKTYGVGMFAYDHFLMPDDPVGQGVFGFRTKLDGGIGRWFRYSFHHQMGATVMSEAMSLTMSPTGGSTGEEIPQAVDLSWAALEGANHTISGRMDRMWISFRVPHFDFTVGRQPVYFGSAFFFTPMDLVSPFSPVVIDREYKPGIDSARADIYIGMSGKISIVAAHAGSWDLEGSILAAHGGFTVGVFDLGFFAGEIYKSTVFGFDFSGALGPVAVYGEATVTLEKDETPFVRAVVGANHRFDIGLSLMGEFYVQSLGGADPEDYLALTATDRFQRGELWAMGRYYGALTLTYELTPLINVSAFVVANLRDPSFLVGPSLSWSVADNVELAAGLYLALGKRPDEMDEMDFLNEDFTVKTEEEILASIPVNSEFGLSPSMAYLNMKVYF